MNVEIVGNAGIRCDNPECDFIDKEAPDEKLADWLGVPCPKCGQNLLTQEDLDSSISLRKAMAFVNSMTPEQLEEFSKAMGINPADFENISNECTVDIHNGVRFEFKEKETPHP